MQENFQIGIRIVDDVNIEYTKDFVYRDAYYQILRKLITKENIGHAIALVGLRRTGKTVILNQLHMNAESYGVKRDEVLHITLSAYINGKEVTRDQLDGIKLNGVSEICYPSLEELESFIKEIRVQKTIKCIFIDEITLCREFILGSKGFVDALVDSGIILIMAGTESASFTLASENDLYTRLILEDISYIPFGEYCRLKRMPLSTLEEKKRAMDIYISHGNILDDNVVVDDRYLEDALGVNLALSISNADELEFLYAENSPKQLVELIIKYYKLIGESITTKTVQDAITRADISRAFKNENNRRKANQKDTIPVDKIQQQQAAIEGANAYFSKYVLDFDKSQIQLENSQLEKIDELFTKMGLLYNLSMIPEVEVSVNGAVDADDICLIHSLSYNMAKKMIDEYLSMPKKVSDADAEIVANVMESTLYGKILEEIVVLQFIKGLEKQAPLLKCIKAYGSGKFQTVRKCSKHRMYKYNNKIYFQDDVVKAEIDIVRSFKDSIELIEIKKSRICDQEQVRWLKNPIVVNEIRDKISYEKQIKKYVYYLGEPITDEDVEYFNIVDVLIADYERNFKMYK